MNTSVSDALTKAVSQRAMQPPRAATVSTQAPYPANDQEFMLSLARGLSVISTFSEQRRNLTMAEISVLTGLSRAVVRRCLHTLKHLGYVTSYAKEFSLRPKVLSLGHPYLTCGPLAALSQPYLEKITSALHESCSMATLDGDSISYIARSAATLRIMSVDLHVGSELPAWCTSMGRVLLAQQPAAELHERLRKTKFVSLTRHTITNIPALMSILKSVRSTGYCLVNQELEVGLKSIAVPVLNMAGEAVAALNVGVHSERYSNQQLKSLAMPVLKAITGELRQLLI